jgi:hypothetical protein
MRIYLYILLFLFGVTASSTEVFAQGCVAVRNMASPVSVTFDSIQHASSWQLSFNYRYFHSYKHFKGDVEQTQRVEQGTNVINNDNSLVIGTSYRLNNRWSFAAIVPLVYMDRSSLYEHKGNSSGERYHTSSHGIGDIRLSAYYSVVPYSSKGNFTVGMGIKLPTGNSNYKDYFHKQEGLELLPVDQSIQPGDGGWGITTEFEFSKRISGNIFGYVTGFYLFNPRNTNGTLLRSSLQDGIPLSNEMSVSDQFLFGAGARYMTSKVQLGLGARYEGIPVRDIFNGSDGFRRPGYIISLEPSVIYAVNSRHTFGLSFPVALYRNRTQSVLDKDRTEVTGEYKHGDAAFADWLLSVFYVLNL